MDVTVITPTIAGRESLLEECKASVKNQIEPVVDHIWLLDTERKGPAFTRNILAKQVNTEWIAFLDDDNILLPNHFELHKEFLDEADIIFSWYDMIFPDGGQTVFKSSYSPDEILSGHNTIDVTATVRKSIFDKVGGFSETARFEDLALWQELIKVNARFKCIEEITWQYRISPNGRNASE